MSNEVGQVQSVTLIEGFLHLVKFVSAHGVKISPFELLLQVAHFNLIYHERVVALDVRSEKRLVAFIIQVLQVLGGSIF